MGVSTGKTSADDVRSFAHHICKLNEGKKSVIERIQSVTETEESAAPVGNRPQHWLDSWHELEGGNDPYRSTSQCGVELL